MKNQNHRFFGEYNDQDFFHTDFRYGFVRGDGAELCWKYPQHGKQHGSDIFFLAFAGRRKGSMRLPRIEASTSGDEESCASGTRATGGKGGSPAFRRNTRAGGLSVGGNGSVDGVNDCIHGRSHDSTDASPTPGHGANRLCPAAACSSSRTATADCASVVVGLTSHKEVSRLKERLFLYLGFLVLTESMIEVGAV